MPTPTPDLPDEPSVAGEPGPPTQPPTAFEGMSNTELAMVRTNLAVNRTDMAEKRTGLSEHRTGLSVERTDLAEARTELARERTRAAEERTLMAWIRTSLSMITFGFGIDRFFKYVDTTQAPSTLTQLSEERLLGLSLITLGVVALGGALISHWNTLRSLDRRDYHYAPGGSLGFTIGIALLFIGLAAFVPLVAGEVQLGEIFTVNSQLIQTLAGLSIFILMISMGLAMVPGTLINLLKQPNLLARALIAALVLFPLIAGGVIYAFDLSARSSLALVLLAAAPAAPLLTKRATMAGADVAIAAALQVLLAISAVVVTPLLLAVFAAPYPEARASIPFLTVAKQIITVQLLPLGLGILIRRLAAGVADEISGLMVTIANTTFLVLAFFLVGISVNLMPEFSLKSLGAFAVVAGLGLAVGHGLGGPSLASRGAVATATVARNAGLALYIAIANQQPGAVLAILAYLIVGIAVALPYNGVVKRQLKQQREAETSPVPSG